MYEEIYLLEMGIEGAMESKEHEVIMKVLTKIINPL